MVIGKPRQASGAKISEFSPEGVIVIDNLNLLECPLHPVSSEQLTGHVENTSTNFIALGERSKSVTEKQLQEAVALLNSEPALNAVLLIPFSEHETLAAWEHYPNRLAALRENPTLATRAIVGRTSDWKNRGITDCAEPVWDLMIRLTQESGCIRALDCPLSEAEPQNEWPDLAPDEPGSARSWLFRHLEEVTVEELVPQTTSPPDAIALKAGFFQMHDYLNASHELSQSIEGKGRNQSGDYWHAIMHRRELDYSNAKYWFRNVGSHPILEDLAETVDSLLSQLELEDNPAAEIARQKLSFDFKWDPLAFVDFCQLANTQQDPKLTRLAKRIQWQEMIDLLDHTYRDASE